MKLLSVYLSASLFSTLAGTAQTPDSASRREGRPNSDGPPPVGPGGPLQDRGRGGGGGGMGGMQQHVELVEQFDRDGDGRLNTAERKAAREFLAKQRAEGRNPRRPGPRGGGENQEPPPPGQKLSPADVKSFPGAPLYDALTLRHKLLAVPELKARYLGYIRNIAEQWLDWNKLGPLAKQYQSLIAADVKTDARKLYSAEAFEKGVTEDIEEQAFRGPRRSISLKNFVEQRRAFLLNHPEVKKATPVPKTALETTDSSSKL